MTVDELIAVLQRYRGTMPVDVACEPLRYGNSHPVIGASLSLNEKGDRVVIDYDRRTDTGG